MIPSGTELPEARKNPALVHVVLLQAFLTLCEDHHFPVKGITSMCPPLTILSVIAPPPQDPSPLRGTLGSSLRSPAEGEVLLEARVGNRHG